MIERAMGGGPRGTKALLFLGASTCSDIVVLSMEPFSEEV